MLVVSVGSDYKGLLNLKETQCKLEQRENKKCEVIFGKCIACCQNRRGENEKKKKNNQKLFVIYKIISSCQ